MTFDPVTLCQQLIRVPSVTPDTGAALDVLDSYLSQLGFVSQRFIFSSGGTYPVPNLYARLGHEEPHFCFAGHTDVVPPGNEAAWDFPPFEAVISNDVLYGRGAADMKGAIAAFICAVDSYLRSHRLTGSISLLITGDEEAEAINGTKATLKEIENAGERFDACLVGEASCEKSVGDTLKVGRRGSLSGLLTVKGHQGHVAYPHLAENPLKKMIAILQEIYSTSFDQGDEVFPPSSFEVTSIDTGNKTMNLIPEQTQAYFNIRYNPQQTEKGLIEKLHHICQKWTQKYSLEWLSKGDPFYTKNCFLTEVLQKSILESTGLSPHLSTAGGTSDGRFIHRHCPVVEFGLVNQSIHKINENVRIQDLHKLKDIYTKVLINFFSKPFKHRS